MVKFRKDYNLRVVFTITVILLSFPVISCIAENHFLRVPMGEEETSDRVEKAGKRSLNAQLNDVYERMKAKLAQGIEYREMAEEWDEIRKILISIMRYKMIGKDFSEIEEIGDIIWLKVFTSIDSYEDKGFFSAWIGSITDHAWFDMLRREDTAKRKTDQLSADGDFSTPPDVEDEIVSKLDLQAILENIINKDHRLIVTLASQGYNPNEISKKTGFKSEKVRTVMRRLTRKVGQPLLMKSPKREKILSEEKSRELASTITPDIGNIDHRRILELWAQGYNVSKIAKERGFSYAMVRSVIFRLRGIEQPPLVSKSVTEKREEVNQSERELAASIVDYVDDPAYRHIIKLRLKGYKLGEIVEETGLPINMVRNFISRLRGTQPCTAVIKAAKQRALESAL